MNMKFCRRDYLEKHAALAVLLASAAVGFGCFLYYYAHGLSTVHYDAKAHLVVARRMVDSTTPGYAQMGAHWLPLIHLLYLPFIGFESQYRTALLPSLLSVGAFAVCGWMIFRITLRMTGSRIAALFAAAVLVGNPNLQLLQSAPLTEPVYMALFLLATDAFLNWRERSGRVLPWAAAAWAALGALCRYEGWIFLAGVLALILYDAWQGFCGRKRALQAIAVYTGMSVLPVAAHFGYIFLRLGDSFFHRVARGSPAPYETYKRPVLSVVYHFGELAQAATLIPLLIGIAGLVYCLIGSERRRRYLPCLLLWLPSLINVAALYWGLIYRVRYSLLLVPAVAAFGGVVLSRPTFARRMLILACMLLFFLPWLSWAFPVRWEYYFMSPSTGIFVLPAAALILLMAALAGARHRWLLIALAVLSMHFPVLLGENKALLAESLEHQYIEPERKAVLDYLLARYDGSRILIDVGRLAPLMYDSGLPLKEFIYHDGNLRDWDRASVKPRAHAGWLCAEKGDEIWELLHVDPHWADGYSLGVKTENYVLYQLIPEDRGKSQ